MTPLDVDPIASLATVRPRGPLSAARITGLLEAMLDDPHHRPGMAAVWDLRDCDVLGLSRGAMRRVAGYTSAHAARLGEARMALVATSDAAFGVARMYEILALGGRLEYRCFRDVDEARSWALAGTLTPVPAPGGWTDTPVPPWELAHAPVGPEREEPDEVPAAL